MLAMAVGLACAACTSGPSRSQSPRPRPSTASPIAHHVSTRLHEQTGRGFVHLVGGPNAFTVLASARNLESGQHGVVLSVRGVGNLVGLCGPGHLAVKFRLTPSGLGSPVVTEVRKPLARPAGLYLLLGLPPPSPVGASSSSRSSRSLGRPGCWFLACLVGDADSCGRRLRILRERCAPDSRIGFSPPSGL